MQKAAQMLDQKNNFEMKFHPHNNNQWNTDSISTNNIWSKYQSLNAKVSRKKSSLDRNKGNLKLTC